jgi:hypothetical protein
VHVCVWPAAVAGWSQCCPLPFVALLLPLLVSWLLLRLLLLTLPLQLLLPLLLLLHLQVCPMQLLLLGLMG